MAVGRRRKTEKKRIPFLKVFADQHERQRMYRDCSCRGCDRVICFRHVLRIGYMPGTVLQAAGTDLVPAFKEVTIRWRRQQAETGPCPVLRAMIGKT